MTTMIPPFNEHGDLPVGIYPAGWAEIEARFGSGRPVRIRAFHKLQLLHNLAALTGKLQRFLVFGSFVSDEVAPRDLDIILVMNADFKVEECPRESRTLFNHADADARFGASAFWLREGMLPEEMMTEFFDTWQTKRDGNKRGLLEVTHDQ